MKWLKTAGRLWENITLIPAVLVMLWENITLIPAVLVMLWWIKPWRKANDA